jgi:hypothetical protein
MYILQWFSWCIWLWKLSIAVMILQSQSDTIEEKLTLYTSKDYVFFWRRNLFALCYEITPGQRFGQSRSFTVSPIVISSFGNAFISFLNHSMSCTGVFVKNWDYGSICLSVMPLIPQQVLSMSFRQLHKSSFWATKDPLKSPHYVNLTSYWHSKTRKHVKRLNPSYITNCNFLTNFQIRENLVKKKVISVVQPIETFLSSALAW